MESNMMGTKDEGLHTVQFLLASVILPWMGYGSQQQHLRKAKLRIILYYITPKRTGGGGNKQKMRNGLEKQETLKNVKLLLCL